MLPDHADFDEIMFEEIVTELMDMGYPRDEAEIFARDMME